MIKIEFDTAGVLDRFISMGRRFENFSPLMEEEFTTWQTADMNRRSPDTERPDRNTVATTVKARGRKTREQRALARVERRFKRRLVPWPVRRLRRYARIGRKPARVLLPAPIRRLRRLRRQVRGVAAGRPRAIGRAVRPLGVAMRMRRRAIMRAELMGALSDRIFGLATRGLRW